MNYLDYAEIDAAFESVVDAAIESRIISDAERKQLSDDCFAICRKDKDGNFKRSYPLYVPNDAAKTQQLIQTAVDMFHYCKPEWKSILAKELLKAFNKCGDKIRINKRNQIFKYIKETELPTNVTVYTTAKKEN